VETLQPSLVSSTWMSIRSVSDWGGEPGLVRVSDLGIEDEGPGQRPLLHAAGDLPRELLLGPCRPTIFSFSSAISLISFSDFLVCSRRGKATLS